MCAMQCTLIVPYAIVTKCSNYATKEVGLESVKDEGDHVYHSTGPQRSSAISVYLC